MASRGGIVGSFLRARAQTENPLSKDSIADQLKALSSRTDELKVLIFNKMFRHYAEFAQWAGSTTEMNKQVEGLISDLCLLKDRMKVPDNQEVLLTISNCQKIESEVRNLESVGLLLDSICKLHEENAAFPGMFHVAKDYVAAAQCLLRAESLLTNIRANCPESRVVEALEDQVRQNRVQLAHHLHSLLDSVVQWQIPSSQKDVSSFISSTRLVVSFIPVGGHDHAREVLSAVLIALEKMDLLNKVIRQFCNLVMSYLVKPVLRSPGYSPVEDVDRDAILKLVLNPTNSTSSSDVFLGLESILKFIHNWFLSKVVMNESDGLSSESKEDHQSFRTRVGAVLWPLLVDLLIKDFFPNQISSKPNDFQHQLLEPTEHFEQSAVSLGITSSDRTPLSDFVRKSSAHAISKKVQDILTEARLLVLTDNGSFSPVSNQDNQAFKKVDWTRLKDVVANGVNINMEEIWACSSEDSHPKAVFALPVFCVRGNTQKLLKLIYSTLLEATTGGSESAPQLFNAVRLVFELYHCLVNSMRSEYLGFPQQSALLHNDCMYLAHHCITLGHQFKMALPAQLAALPCCFVDMFVLLRRLGETCLKEELVHQQQLLDEALKESLPLQNMGSTTKSTVVSRSFQKVTQILLQLGNLWRGVLSRTVFLNSMAALINSLLGTVTLSVVSLQDISIVDAAGLTAHLPRLSAAIPHIIEGPAASSDTEGTVMDYTKLIPGLRKYRQLSELMILSLQEITQGWDSGKGPLAETFEAGEIRGLILSRFQNTDRRSAALATIR